MKKSKKSIAVGLSVVVVATVTGLAGVRAKLGCIPPPPRSELKMIEEFKADPLLNTAPYGGRLIAERSGASACSDYEPGHSSPQPTNVARKYRTSTPQSFDQLRQRFDQPAAAAGWRIDEAQTHPARWKAIVTAAQLRRMPPHIRHLFSRPVYEPAIVTYCRRIGDQPIQAIAVSSDTMKYGDVDPGVGVFVSITTMPDLTGCY